jgi:hypothetical protein
MSTEKLTPAERIDLKACDVKGCALSSTTH